MLGNRPNHAFACACEMSASSAISATFNIPEHLAATASANFISHLKLAEIHRACERVKRFRSFFGSETFCAIMISEVMPMIVHG